MVKEFESQPMNDTALTFPTARQPRFFTGIGNVNQKAPLARSVFCKLAVPTKEPKCIV